MINQQTILEASEGDEQSKEEVLGYSIDFLECFIGSHIYSVADTDDLVQEVLIQINRCFDRGNEITNLDGMLANFARKFILRYRNGEYRAGKRRQLSANSYRTTEMPFSDVFGDETTMEDLENIIDRSRFI